jgi:nicotinate-nucleotide adenylyltransferase
MTRLAAATHPAFDAWDVELRRTGPSYTVDTVCTVLAERPGSPLEPLRPPFPSSRPVHRVSGPSLPISATAVRARVAAGLSVRYLVPDAVLQYIEARRLYT